MKGAGRRPRLTYANVTATLALFLALGGVGYAATQLPKNSVGSAQIRNHSVAALDLQPGTLPACPKGTALAAGVCIETSRREPEPLLFAVIDCSNDNMRMPTEAELAAFGRKYVSSKKAPPREWVAGYYFLDNEAQGDYMTVNEDSTGLGTERATAEYAYRCAIPPS